MYNQLMKVSKGFQLVYIGVLIVVASAILAFVGSVAFGAAAAGAGAAGNLNVAAAGAGLGAFGIFLVAIALLAMAGNITGLVGKFFCLAIPERAGAAKQLLVVSVVFEVVGMGISVLNNLTSAGIVPNKMNLIVQASLPMLGLILQLASAVLFLFFCKSVAQFIRRRELADKSMSVLTFFGISIACYLVGIVVIIVSFVGGGGVAAAGGKGAGAAAGAAMGVGACLGSIVALVGLIFALVGLVKFVNLMKELSDGVGRYARKNRKKFVEEEEEDEYEIDSEDEDDRVEDEEEFEVIEEDEEEERRRRKQKRNRRYDD